MEKENKKMVFLIIWALVLTLTMCGCKIEEISEEDEKLERNVTTNIGAKGTNELVDKAESIADDVVDLIGVEDATVIIYKEQVTLVVELSQDVDFSHEMKEMIKSVVLKNETKVKNIFISNDAKLFDKVDNIAQDLIKGEDIKKYSQEIDKILKKIEKENKDG